MKRLLGVIVFFGAALIQLLRLFGHDPIRNATPAICGYIAIVTTATTLLAIRLKKAFPDHNLLIINFALLIASVNCWYCDILSFPECILITGIGMALAFASIGLIADAKKQSWGVGIAASLCLTLATGVYQQFLGLFAVYAIALCCERVWHSEDKSLKGLLRIFVKPATIWMSSGVIYYVIAKIVCLISGIEPNSRISHSIKDLLLNAILILRNVHSYAKGRGYFRTEVLTLCFLLAVGLFGVALIHQAVAKKDVIRPGYVAVSVIIAVLCSMLAAFLSCSTGSRAMFPFFAGYGLIVLVIPESGKCRYRTAMSVVLLVVLLLNIGKAVECEMNLKKINTEDQLWAKQVIAEIETYEKNTGTEIKKIAFASDTECDMAKITPAYTQSAVTANYAYRSLLCLFTGDRSCVIDPMSDEAFDRYFAEKEWDQYLPSEQIVFQDGVAYVCSY